MPLELPTHPLPHSIVPPVAPDLEGRVARCPYCKKEQPSNDALAFFKFKGPGSREADEACANCGYYEIAHDSAKLDGRPSVIDTGKCSGFVAHGPFDRDEFYDGCMGWD